MGPIVNPHLLTFPALFLLVPEFLLCRSHGVGSVLLVPASSIDVECWPTGSKQSEELRCNIAQKNQIACNKKYLIYKGIN